MKKVFSRRNALWAFQAVFVVSVGMLLGALWRMGVPETKAAISTDTTAVKVTMRREGKVTRVFVQNDERSEITMTFAFNLVNMKSDVNFPFSASFPPGETQAFTLSPDAPDRAWEYSYTNYFKLGSMVAVPDDYVYSLPYAPGRAYRVTQGYNGSFSHKGSNRYAIDWQMPEGTPVYAARGGLVVKVKDDSDTGGAGMQYDKFNNYVLIRHDDGTLGHYCHLKQGGVKVSPGQRVTTGQPIALSGNTGFSSGAHLHFCVFKTLNGRQRESLPVQFKDSTGQAVELVEGRRYKAGETQQAMSTAQVETVVR